jgi:hypothetical protein
MADENKNKKRDIWDMPHGTKLHTAHVVQLRHPDDPEVRELERKHIIGNEGRIPGKTYKYLDFRRRENSKYINDPFDKPCEEGISKYIYEPYVRYKRTGNPDYKRYKGYSLAGILTGGMMLVTGFASGNIPFAYAGAALAIASLGYHSGHWWSKERTDRRFEKVPGLEALVEKRLFKEPEKDDALYIRRAYKADLDPLRGRANSWAPKMVYFPLNEPTAPSSGLGYAGVMVTSILALIGFGLYNKGSIGAEPILYAAGSTALATLGHYIGFIFGKKRAKPEYQKVSGLEEKD